MLGWERNLLGRLQITSQESQHNMEGTKEFNSNNNTLDVPIKDTELLESI